MAPKPWNDAWDFLNNRLAHGHLYLSLQHL